MKSSRTPEPVVVVKLVSKMLVFDQYFRLELEMSVGESLKWPPLVESSMRLKIAGESNLGMQHQSMELSEATRAEPCMSPIRP